MATAANWRAKLRQIEARGEPDISLPDPMSTASTVSTGVSQGAVGTVGTVGRPSRNEKEGDSGQARGRPQDGQTAAVAPDHPGTLSRPSGDSAADHFAAVPQTWAEGFARLDRTSPPDGFDKNRWRVLIDDAGKFLDRWGAEAARLGWTALDVFGIHPVAPGARYDAAGLVVLVSGGEVISIRPDRASIRSGRGGALLTYLRSPRTGTVALWEIVSPSKTSKEK